MTPHLYSNYATHSLSHRLRLITATTLPAGTGVSRILAAGVDSQARSRLEVEKVPAWTFVTSHTGWGGFLNSQQINMINAFIRKARRFGLWSPTCLCDVCLNIWDWLTVDYLIAYKVRPTASHICFQQKSTTLANVLEVTVILSHLSEQPL